MQFRECCKVHSLTETISSGDMFFTSLKILNFEGRENKLSLMLLHTDVLVKACCSLFHGACVINSALSLNVGVPSMFLCSIRQLLPFCTMNFVLQSSVHFKT